MRQAAAIARVTMRQVLGRRRLIGLGLLGLFPAIVAWFATANLGERATIERFNEAPIAILFLIVVPVVSLIFGSGSLGDERRDGTLSFVALRPIPRRSIATAKLVAAWLAAIAVIVIAAGFTSIAGAARLGDWSIVFPVIAGTAIAALCYVSVFLILGYVTSRAVMIGLAYLFIWESGITNAAPSLANVSLFRIGLSAYVGMVPESRSVLDEALGVIAPGAGGAAIKALGVAVVCVIAASFLLRRTDQL